MNTIERSHVCPECHSTIPGDGLFCSTQCHDVWNGLTTWRKLAEVKVPCPRCGLLNDHRYPCEQGDGK